MKRIIAALAALFIFIALAACTTGEAVNADKAAINAAASFTIMSAQDSFLKFSTTKTSAAEKLLAKFEPNYEFYMQYFDNLMSAVLDSYYLIPLTLLNNGPDELKKIELCNFTDYKLQKTDQGYEITYVDPDGNAVKQVCVYEPSTDYMKTVVTDTQGKEVYFLEYIRTGDVYAAQYTSDGKLSKAFFGQPGIEAFGVQPDEGDRESLYGKTSFSSDFVKNNNIYFILEGDKLTITENHDISTY